MLRLEQFLALTQQLQMQLFTPLKHIERHDKCRQQHDKEQEDDDDSSEILLEDAYGHVHHLVFHVDIVEREVQILQAIEVEDVLTVSQCYGPLLACLQKRHHIVGKRAAHDVVARRIAAHGPVADSHVGHGECGQFRIVLAEGVCSIAHYVAVRIVYAPCTYQHCLRVREIGDCLIGINKRHRSAVDIPHHKAVVGLRVLLEEGAHGDTTQCVVGHKGERVALRIEVLYEVEVLLHVIMIHLTAHDVEMFEVGGNVIRHGVPLLEIDGVLRHLHDCRASQTHHHWCLSQFLIVVEGEVSRRHLHAKQHDAGWSIATAIILIEHPFQTNSPPLAVGQVLGVDVLHRNGVGQSALGVLLIERADVVADALHIGIV